MIFKETHLQGVHILEPKIYKDNRGYFFESFNLREFQEHLGDIEFVQDNESRSSYGVIRGLHFQKPPFDQAKLVRVVHGTILDICLDLRQGSSTYGECFSIELSEENHCQLYIPRGFAHGFSVLSKEAVFQYKCDNFYAPQSEGGILWNDPTLNIDWGIPLSEAIISEKDKLNDSFQSFESPFSL